MATALIKSIEVRQLAASAQEHLAAGDYDEADRLLFEVERAAGQARVLARVDRNGDLTDDKIKAEILAYLRKNGPTGGWVRGWGLVSHMMNWDSRLRVFGSAAERLHSAVDALILDGMIRRGVFGGRTRYKLIEKKG